MRVSTNVNSMVAQRILKGHTIDESRENVRLSSGDRITSAAYDPSGLAISEKLRAKSRSLYQAERNSNDAISLLQVAEGSLGVMADMSQRLRELAMQASTDTVSDMDRSIIDKEFQSLKNEIKRLTESTKFNGNHIINDKGSVYDLQIGIGGDAFNDRLRYDMKRVMDSSNNFGIGNVDLRSKDSAQNSLKAISSMMSQISSSRAELGAMSNRMTSVIQNLQMSKEGTAATNSKIRDTDVAKESAEKMKTQIAANATSAMLANANSTPSVILKLFS
ncbi:MAG: flagellin FliC [Bacteriovoracaceae bacterium]|nr:flagellin FliC [Bacteriovoracaceae bacterium]